MDNVIKFKKFPDSDDNYEARLRELIDELPDNAAIEAKQRDEEEMLTALLMSNRLVSSVEQDKVRKIIIVKRGSKGWEHAYCNISDPHEIIEALAPLWMSARTASLGGR